MTSQFTSLGAQTAWRGKLIRVGIEHFRHADGGEVSREKVWHPGAVGILAVDSEHVWLTRQPREVVGAAASLEIPAGKLDVAGESHLDAAKRELGEEIGKQADNWHELLSFYPSPGFSDERVWLYHASELRDVPGGPHPDAHERIEVVPWPLERIDQAIAQCEDAKSLIALMWLARRS